jgi:hypothetical protein
MGRMQDELSAIRAHPAATSFACLFVVGLLVALLQGEKPFYFDSGSYWLLSETFSANGGFSLLDFEYTGIRGYALPLTYFFVREVGDFLTFGDALQAMVFNAALVAAIGALLGPRLAQIAWPEQRWGIARRLALGALILVFWRGYLSYPLSDFPALATALLALVAVASPTSPAWMAVGGLAAAYATNARPSYLLLVPLLLLLVLWDWWQHRQGEAAVPRRLLCIGLFVAGLVVVSLPQSLLDHRNFDGYSPVPGGNDLAGLQYTEGLRLQRYETFVGEAGARMEYLDPHTEDVLAGLEGGVVADTPQYAETALSHPLTIAGVFLRHVVNGLDARYPTPYVERLESGSNKILRFAGFLLVFLALFRLLWPRGRRSLGPARWRFPAALLAVCATSLPSAIETRFLLPVFVLASLLVLAPGWPLPVGPAEQGLRRYRTLALAALAGLVYFAIVGAIVSDATDNLRLV